MFARPRPSPEYYVGTDVFVSDNPFNFDIGNRVSQIASHVLEVVTDGAKQYVSYASWGQGSISRSIVLGWGRVDLEQSIRKLFRHLLHHLRNLL